ncbi:MAG: biotin--[acetyl-CoA-carboxylase] ligase [Planctomycetes bacterium]|nr:biotin--[acetyl-CoA-carboxylase] ligase [Planctomycetota bacterium]MCB9887939.1 biotin--[acetyl-CoA-carboxylase] ligase [Planctomycetota bacterium]
MGTPGTRFVHWEHHTECDSTQALSQSAPAGPWGVFWADHQTDGRGRQGRSWSDIRGRDLAATFRVTGIGPLDAVQLAVAIPVAAARTVVRVAPELDAALRIKWPNDLVVSGRKLCGILIDVDGQGSHVYHIGLGLNVNSEEFAGELRSSATSLRLHTGRAFDRASLLAELAAAVDDGIGQLERGDLAGLEQEFRARIGLVGGSVRARVGTREVEGVLHRLDTRCAVVGAEELSLAHLSALRACP